MNRIKSTFVVLLIFSLVYPASSISLVKAIEDSWTAKAPLPLACWGVVAVNDKIYAIAGSGNYDNITYSNNAVFEYDSHLDTWTLKNTMPIKRYSFALAAYQNKIYVIGEPDGLNQVYDTETDTWENRTSMPTPRTQLEANVVNGKIYLIAGRTGDAGSTVALNEVYDPETDSWTTKEPIPYPVVQYASAVVDDKIYVIGGQDEYEIPLNLNVTQIYDTTTETWTLGAPIPKVAWQAAASATTGELAPKRIYIIGGLPADELIGVDWNQVYDPENDTWTVGESMPTARFKLDVVVLNDTLYVIRGSPFFNLSGTYCYENEQYTPVGYIPEFPSLTSLLIMLVAVVVAAVFYKREIQNRGSWKK
jgi:N-acetylneuraminic acid mutarotase